MKPTTAMSWSRQARTIFSGSPFFRARFALCSRWAWDGAKRRRKKSSRVGFSRASAGAEGSSPMSWRGTARPGAERAFAVGKIVEERLDDDALAELLHLPVLELVGSLGQRGCGAHQASHGEARRFEGRRLGRGSGRVNRCGAWGQGHLTLAGHPSLWTSDRRGDACVAPTAAVVSVALTSDQHRFAGIPSFSPSTSTSHRGVKCPWGSRHARQDRRQAFIAAGRTMD